MTDTEHTEGSQIGSNGVGGARVMVVDDEKLIRWSISKRLKGAGFEVTTCESGEDCLARLGEEHPDLVLLDVKLPGLNGLEVLREVRKEAPQTVVIMLSAHGTIDMAVDAMKHGAVDFLTKPFDLAVLETTIRRAVENVRLKKEVAGLTAERDSIRKRVPIVGSSPPIQELKSLVEKVARSSATTVLIQGESGSGKEVIARAIHEGSLRAPKPFMTINCTSIPEQLVESELLGHERGAFTDAKQLKKGLFELTDGGTLLLDEIGDMPLGAQAKLLRLLEEKTFKRVGGTVDLRVDVRVVASTHRDLKQLVADGGFRQDLFYRLNIMAIHLPSLRDHVEDVGELSSWFIASFNREFKRNVRGMTPDALAMLEQYHWPGNVRELRNVVERAYILEAQDQIGPEHLPPEVRGVKPSGTNGSGRPAKESMDLTQLEIQAIQDALEKTGGNQTQAAKMLGISRDTLRYRVKKFDLL